MTLVEVERRPSRVRDDRNESGGERALTSPPRSPVRRRARPGATRPRSRPARARPVGASSVPCGRARAAAEKWMLLAAAGFSCFFVLLVGFVGFASAVPTEPAGAMVVQVRPGDTLPELAHEFAPHRDAGEVMHRIVELNSLDRGQPVPAGPLVVPTDHP